MDGQTQKVLATLVAIGSLAGAHRKSKIYMRHQGISKARIGAIEKALAPRRKNVALCR